MSIVQEGGASSGEEESEVDRRQRELYSKQQHLLREQRFADQERLLGLITGKPFDPTPHPKNRERRIRVDYAGRMARREHFVSFGTGEDRRLHRSHYLGAGSFRVSQ